MGTPGKYSNDEVAMKYSLPTRRILGSGFHLKKGHVSFFMLEVDETNPVMMGFFIASTTNSNEHKNTETLKGTMM
jgi:hypothetical protein